VSGPQESGARERRLDESGEPAVEHTITFTAVDAEGAEITRDGVTRRVTWEELRQHVPAGTYECVVCVVADPAAGEV